MDKAQALNSFWNGFGIPAYDESTVPDSAAMPYITYEVTTGSVGGMVALSGSIWYRSSSWAEITRKANEIAAALGNYGHYAIKIDNGYMWMVQGSPFAQRMSEPDDKDIRRMLIHIEAEFLTAY